MRPLAQLDFFVLVMGLNPGLPQWAVVNPPTFQTYESAALINNMTGLGHYVSNTAMGWKPANDSWMSLVNGIPTLRLVLGEAFQEIKSGDWCVGRVLGC